MFHCQRSLINSRHTRAHCPTQTTTELGPVLASPGSTAQPQLAASEDKSQTLLPAMVGKQTTGTPPMNGGHDHTDVGIASMRETNPSTPLTPSKDHCGDGTDSAAASTGSVSKDSVFATATTPSAMEVKPLIQHPNWAVYGLDIQDSEGEGIRFAEVTSIQFLCFIIRKPYHCRLFLH